MGVVGGWVLGRRYEKIRSDLCLYQVLFLLRRLANIINRNSPINVLLPRGLTDLSYWSETEAKCVSHVADYSAKIYANNKISE